MRQHSGEAEAASTAARTRTGRLTRPPRHSCWNTGSPTGREPYGDGAPVVVRGRESRPHGEGGQVDWKARCEVRVMRDAETVRAIHQERGAKANTTDPRSGVHWRAVCGESRKHGCVSRKG